MTGPEFSRTSADKLRGSGIDPVAARGLGIRPVATAADLPDEFRTDPRATTPGMVIDWARPDGEIVPQYRPDDPPERPDPRTGRVQAVKYLFPPGSYVGVARVGAWPERPRVVLLVEGSLQSRSVARWVGDGTALLATPGAWGWSHDQLPSADLSAVNGAEVLVILDADAGANRQVYDAGVRLASVLTGKGATDVRFPRLGLAGTQGVDDLLGSCATDDERRTLVESIPELVPGRFGDKPADRRPDARTDAGNDVTVAADDPAEDIGGKGLFTDARLSRLVSDDVFRDRYLWTSGLGWYAWTGQRWEATDEVAVIETVRGYLVGRYAEAVREHRDSAGAWHKTLGHAQIKAIVALARGLVRVPAEALDADPDALNTPGGIVNLRSGAVRPHDPAEHHTKITRGGYRPGHVHPDWVAACEALPEPERVWLRNRIGQAATGHTTPDGVLPLLQGELGENGKSLLTGSVIAALGDYAAPASAKLFTQAKGTEHSTERADLRGRRFLVAEEVAEGRSIDVAALKAIQDVPQITARYVYRDNITFRTSHSLFATSNYRPIVAETDGGTWRRLALVRFPYRFRPEGEPVRPELGERPADSGLKRRLDRYLDGDRADAVVTWVVDGALAVAADQVAALRPTPQIRRDTEAWRTTADRLWGFWNECLIPAPNGAVERTDLHEAFSSWLTESGHVPWSRETFHSRFAAHERTLSHSVEMRRVKSLSGWLVHRTREGGSASIRPLPSVPRLYVGVRFRTGADDQATDPDPPTDLGGSNGSNPPGTFHEHPSREEVPKGLERLEPGITTRSSGGPADTLACRHCGDPIAPADDVGGAGAHIECAIKALT